MTQLWAILGPTASGKTEVALGVAERLDAEIISVDSMQVYRGMDIGTAKATSAERERVPHHMIDIVEPEESFHVAQFREMGREIIAQSSRPLLVVGGSGMHFRALVDPMTFAPADPTVREEVEGLSDETLREELIAADPTAGSHVDLANRRRVVRAMEIFRLGGGTPTERATTAEAEAIRNYVPELRFRAVGFDPEDRIAERIAIRTTQMRAHGLLEEVTGLAPRLGRTARGAVGYKELLRVVSRDITEDEGFREVESATNHLARRQRTYFRRDPRIVWLPWNDDPEQRVEDALTEVTTPED